VNLGAGPRGGADALDFALGALAGHWDGGILVDTTNPGVMRRAGEAWGRWPGGLLLNGFSGDRGREAAPAIAARHGLGLVVLLMAAGIPRGADERLALAAHLVGLCQDAGLGLDRLWIDPVVAPLGWSDGQDLDAGLLEVLRRLPQVFGEPVQTLAGLSNLTTGAAPGRRLPWMEEVFLALAAGAGLTHALVNVTNPRLVRVARAVEALEGRSLYAPEAFADGSQPPP
jgi:5-methyltetrahydrofolate corrinoid/iron sulfur protein methyltransferase